MPSETFGTTPSGCLCGSEDCTGYTQKGCKWEGVELIDRSLLHVAPWQERVLTEIMREHEVPDYEHETVNLDGLVRRMVKLLSVRPYATKSSGHYLIASGGSMDIARDEFDYLRRIVEAEVPASPVAPLVSSESPPGPSAVLDSEAGYEPCPGSGLPVEATWMHSCPECGVQTYVDAAGPHGPFALIRHSRKVEQ